MPWPMEGVDGSDMGMSQLQHHTLVLHTTQARCCSSCVSKPLRRLHLAHGLRGRCTSVHCQYTALKPRYAWLRSLRSHSDKPSPAAVPSHNFRLFLSFLTTKSRYPFVRFLLTFSRATLSNPGVISSRNSPAIGMETFRPVTMFLSVGFSRR